MKAPKAGGSKPHHDLTVVKDTDGASSHTAVTADSDSDASTTITLVDLFPDLAVIESDAPGDTSAESTDATSSQISSSADEPSSEADSETCLKEKSPPDVECLKEGKQRKKGKVAESESESAESSAAESTSGEGSTSEGASCGTHGSEAAMADSTTSGETSSKQESITDGTSSSVDASSSVQSPNPGNWTPSEDALIISMKEGGETWASIGNAINRSKNEVKKRWHVVKASNANMAESRDEAETETGNTEDSTEETKPKAMVEKKQQKSKKEKTTSTKDKTQEPKKKEAKADSTVECVKAKPREGKKKKQKKVAEEESGPKKLDSDEEDDFEHTNLLRDADSNSSSSTTSGDDADNPGYYERELARQERYIRRHIHPALYPATIALTPPARIRAPSPADKQQRRDDKVLAAVASRREATKWLEMQANFFNVTGRMVPLYAIKARCEAEEDRGKVAGVRSWASSVAGSEELLDPSERPEVPVDALIDDED